MNDRQVTSIIQKLFVLLFLAALTTEGYAQKRVRLRDADILKGRGSEGYQRLIGNRHVNRRAHV